MHACQDQCHASMYKGYVYGCKKAQSKWRQFMAIPTLPILIYTTSSTNLHPCIWINVPSHPWIICSPCHVFWNLEMVTTLTSTCPHFRLPKCIYDCKISQHHLFALGRFVSTLNTILHCNNKHQISKSSFYIYYPLRFFLNLNLFLWKEIIM